MSEVVVVLPFDPVMQIVLARVAAGELHLRNDGDSLFAQLLHDGGLIGYAGRLDDLRSVEDQLLGVSALLEGNLPLQQTLLVTVGDAAGI